MTTIKVSVELRDRINHKAREAGVTAAALIEGLLDDKLEQQRAEAFAKAFATADASYWAEFREWDAVAQDAAADD